MYREQYYMNYNIFCRYRERIINVIPVTIHTLKNHDAVTVCIIILTDDGKSTPKKTLIRKFVKNRYAFQFY